MYTCKNYIHFLAINGDHNIIFTQTDNEKVLMVERHLLSFQHVGGLCATFQRCSQGKDPTEFFSTSG